MRATFNAYLFNPVFWHVWDALHNPKIRYIKVRGGSSAGKTAGVCDALNLYQLTRLVNVFALRKHRVHVDTTIKNSFEQSIDRQIGLGRLFTKMEGEIRVATGAVTTYAGMDDPEKVKGLESYDIVYMNELNQFDADEYTEVKRRLRGRPNQKIIADWNPILKTHWINTEILDESEGWTDLPLDLPEYEELYGAFTKLTDGYAFKKINKAGDTLWINVTYRDNFWIIGHPGNTVPATPGEKAYLNANPAAETTLSEGMFVAPDGNLYGFVDVHTLANFEAMRVKKPNDYRIYGLGQDGLIRTGGEYWASFDEVKHISTEPLKYNPDYPLHITVDNNRRPYITISIWQVIKKEIRQIWEIPAREPDNTALKAALLLDKWLSGIEENHPEVRILPINLYGDPSANSESTVDDEGKSFFAKFKGTLEKCRWKVIDRIGKSAPGVAISGEFINDIYELGLDGWKILINLLCKTSIEDYSLVKKAPDGTMLKEKFLDPTDPDKKRKIEKYGHFSDAKRYFITILLLDLFTEYKNRQGQPRVMSVQE